MLMWGRQPQHRQERRRHLIDRVFLVSSGMNNITSTSGRFGDCALSQNSMASIPRPRICSCCSRTRLALCCWAESCRANAQQASNPVLATNGPYCSHAPTASCKFRSCNPFSSCALGHIYQHGLVRTFAQRRYFIPRLRVKEMPAWMQCCRTSFRENIRFPSALQFANPWPARTSVKASPARGIFSRRLRAVLMNTYYQGAPYLLPCEEDSCGLQQRPASSRRAVL